MIDLIAGFIAMLFGYILFPDNIFIYACGVFISSFIFAISDTIKLIKEKN